jgi:exopolysaccharide biosynthesis polyprenyl glycosylphosphotransferase
MTLVIHGEDTAQAVPGWIVSPRSGQAEPTGFSEGPDALASDKSARFARSTARSAVNWPSRAWGAVDALLAAGSVGLAHVLSPRYEFSVSHAYGIGSSAATFAALLLLASYILGVYDRHNFTSLARMTRLGLLANLLALAGTTLVYQWVGYVQIGRLVLLNTLLLSVAGTFCCRLLARELARRAKVRVMFVGPRRHFRRLRREMRRAYGDFCERPAYFTPNARSTPAERRARLIDAIQAQQPDELIVMDDNSIVGDLMVHCQSILSTGCAIFSYENYCERMLGELPVDSIDHRGVLGPGFRVGSLHTGLVKRPIDIGLAALGLLVGSPLMLLCATLVKVTSLGPVIYRQTRVGRYGRPFSIYKFRTMRADAEKNGAAWAKSGDARVTWVGKILRKTRFDELPQLWNILRGDMSLVGPRPERPEFVQQLQAHIPHYDLRHLVLPGLTGWAQVRFRYGASLEDAQRKLAFDLYYVRHCGLMFDAAILLRTLAAMAKGAR